MRKNKIGIFMLLGILMGVFLIIESTCENIKVSAAETEKTYTVSLDPQGGTVNGESLPVTIGSTYGTLPVPTKTNYVFKGWYTFPSAGTLINANKKVTMAKDHTLYAHWSGKEFEIILDLNGGGDSKKAIVRYGSKYLNQLPAPVRKEYEFTGWYTSKSGGDQIKAGSVYQDNKLKKLYAQWKLKVLTVTFVGFNGESYELDVTCTKTFGTLPVPKREGYTFMGWYTWADYTDSSATPIKSTTKVSEKTPLKLFARWY
ncbi:MAG: internalin-like protein [Anaerocolumna sp.]|jgi:uncharacterized repeat protein (TIGR02543 family)|nr:internalin-like protein [Anaerocolumna sp.]